MNRSVEPPLRPWSPSAWSIVVPIVCGELQRVQVTLQRIVSRSSLAGMEGRGRAS
jgi:hypothetical protein